MKEIEPIVQYSLTNKSGEPLTIEHQDGIESSLTANSIDGLFDLISFWSGYGESELLEYLSGDILRIDGHQFRIVRQVVTATELGQEDNQAIQRLRDEFTEFKKKYNLT